MAERCPNRLFGRAHKFQPRYDKSAANTDLIRGVSVNSVDVPDWFETLRTVTYVRDVCVHCGKTVERSEGGK